jgi:hypothetical protein
LGEGTDIAAHDAVTYTMVGRRAPSLGWSRIHVRIVDVPPAPDDFEGFDLRPYQLQRGTSYELDHRLAELLMAWRYAVPDRRFKSRRASDAL